MRYQTILIHLQLGHPHAALLHLAARLGDRFGAHIAGVAAGEPLQALTAEGCANGLLIEDELDELQREMALAEQDFFAALGHCPNGATWHGNSRCQSIADYIAQVARGADLIVTDVAPGSMFNAQRQLPLAALLLRAGRPVLLAPAPSGPLLFFHALVAWDDSCACRRAASDALPLLRDAARVTVMQVARDADVDEVLEQLDSVCAWLRSHGVTAEPLVRTATGGAPDLGTIAVELGCDLVVAGAYGHSRLRESLLGGATRALLAQQQVAVLLSH